MSSADGSIQLSADQVRELTKRLSHCRHEINGCLSLIMSAMELAELKPDSAPKMMKTAVDQSKKIAAEIVNYSADLERVITEAKAKS